jgi:hypothetical protein
LVPMWATFSFSLGETAAREIELRAATKYPTPAAAVDWRNLRRLMRVRVGEVMVLLAKL